MTGLSRSFFAAKGKNLPRTRKKPGKKTEKDRERPDLRSYLHLVILRTTESNIETHSFDSLTIIVNITKTVF
jgi:hypothetical protein